MNDEDELDRRIRESLTTWAGSVEAEPDLDALAARRSPRPWDHRGTRLLGIAAAILLLAVAVSALRGPHPDSAVSTRADDRSEPTTTEADPSGGKQGTTSSTASTTSTTTTTMPNGPTTVTPSVPSATDGSGAPSGPGTSTPDGSNGDGSESGDGGPPTGCPDNGVALGGNWMYRVRWAAPGDEYLEPPTSYLAVVDLGQWGSDRRVALYVLSDAPEAGDCYIQVTGTDGLPLRPELKLTPSSDTEIHTFGCRNPLLVIPDGSTTDGVTWTFHVREINITGTTGRVVTNGTYTFQDVAGDDNVDFFRRLDCDDSTSI